MIARGSYIGLLFFFFSNNHPVLTKLHTSSLGCLFKNDLERNNLKYKIGMYGLSIFFFLKDISVIK